MKRWVIDIDENGKTKVEGFGFVGKECELPRGVVEELGLTDVEVTTKPEYHAQVQKRTEVRK